MRLLVTRPQEDAAALAATLKQLGHSTLVAPLMDVHIHDGPPLVLDGVQGVLATSANGVRALAKRTARRDIPTYAVGPQTAEAARRAGFSFVRGAEGDAAMLVEAVASWAKPDKGALLHAAGAETAVRMRQALQAKGFAVTDEILYEAVPVAKLPEKAEQALSNNALDGVLLFSPRSAKTFADLVSEAGLAKTCARLACFCISAGTAGALGTLAFARLEVAGAPNQEAMLALLSAPK
jgi:uroporphyrinogen-III synthase